MQVEPRKFLIFDHMQYLNLIKGFWVRNKGNLVVSPLVNCSYINELDFRLLNFSIWTSVDQVMVFLPRSAQLDLVGSVRPVRVN